MAVALDAHGTSVHRDWWSFPGDLLDFTGLFERDGHVFVVLWPYPI
jgi:hypothetical protein